MKVQWEKIENSTIFSRRDLIEKVIFQTSTLLTEFAQSNQFTSVFEASFGHDNPETVERLRSAFLSNRFLEELKIEILPSSRLGGALGAYASAINTIYLSQELLFSSYEKVASVLLEEIGHSIDAQIRRSDSCGDEGAIFAILVQGKALSERQLRDLKTEGDTVTVQIDGQTLELEQQNYDLGSLQGVNGYSDTLYWGDAEDYYTFSIGGTGRTSSQVEIATTSTAVNLVLELYDPSTGQLLYDPNGIPYISDVNNNSYNYEALSLTSFAPGSYTARVYDAFGGQYVSPYLASYNLTITAPSATDGTEFNDWYTQATILDTTDGEEYLTGLAIDDPTDVDWYYFTTTELSTWDHFAQINFNHAAGNLAVALWDEYGGYYPVDTYNDSEFIYLAGLPAGNYYLQVGSFVGHANPNYELIISTPKPLPPDEFDATNANNNWSSASPLGEVGGVYSQSDLSLHSASDQDWLKFETNAIGTFEDYIAINFESWKGDLALALYDDQGYFLNYSDYYGSNQEALPLAGLPAGTYYAQIYSYSDQTNNYDLEISAPGATTQLSPDRFETNNSRSEAQALEELQGLQWWQGLSIHETADEDWFQFDLEREGTRENFAAITFTTVEGDLDLKLYDSAGNFLKDSTGFRNFEKISLQGQKLGYLQVVGYEGATNPNYNLLINAPGETDNDTAQKATPLSQIQGLKIYDELSISHENDIDWYRFSIANTGNGNNFVRIDFSAVEGDLNLALYEYTGTTNQEAGLEENTFDPNNLLLVEKSEKTTSPEEISLETLEAGEYFIQVYGFDEDDLSPYTFTIDAPTETGADSFDDSADNNTRSRATDLNSLVKPGQTTLSLPETSQQSLSIHQASDEDWFKFELATQGKESNFAAIAFDHTLGDLDLELYNDSGIKIDESTGVADLHEIDLAGQAASFYTLRISGYNGATNPEYSLTINAPLQQPTGDNYESNDSREEAKPLGFGVNRIPNLSISQSGDVDWFEFELSDKGNFSNVAGIDFTHGEGDLDLVLYDNSGEEVKRSQGVANTEEISLAGLASGTYYLKVFRFDEAEAETDYQLYYDLPQDDSEDWSETNDTLDTAFDLRNVEGLQTWDALSIHTSEDEDWFKFNLIGNADANDFVSLIFDNTLGDLDLFLYDAAGTNLLESSETATNFEQLSLKGYEGGTYLLKVEGHNSSTNPNYQLVINAPTFEELKDWAEPNDTQDDAENLQTVQGTQVWSGLSLENNTDIDWFKFTTIGEGVTGHAVSIEFDHSEGNLDLRLIDPNGNEYTSTSNSDRERISLAERPAGEYWVKVEGEANSNYSVVIDAPQEAEADWAEDNDTQSKAEDLRDIQGSLVLNGFSIHPANDQDWFKFNLDKPPVAGQIVRIDFNHYEGDLNLEVIDPTGNRFTSTTTKNFEEIALAGKEAGTYYVKVTGVDGATNPEYRLTVVGTPEAKPDDLEPNDHPNEAYELRNIEQSSSNERFGSGFSFPNNGATPSYNFLNSSNYQQADAWLNYGNQILSPYHQQIGSLVGSTGISPLDLYLGGKTSATQFRFSLPNLSIHSVEDEDWFKFTLNQDGQEQQLIELSFDHDLGDLQLDLFESFDAHSISSNEYDQYLVERTNSRSDNEIITLANLAAGEYYVKVSGVNDATHPSYTLTLSAPPSLDETGDWTEPNNNNNQAYDLREVEGSRILSDLSIHNETDTDWFQFETTGEGKEGHVVRIDFNDEQGDLDLILYNENGTEEIARSESTDNSEEISLDGLATGTYQLQVLGYEEATNPNYTFSVFAPDTSINPDNLEPNDDFDNATLLGQNGNISSLSGLTIHPDDSDFFKFTTTSPSTVGNSLSIEFEHAQGDLQLELYEEGSTTPLQTSQSTTNNETISLAELEAGTYYAKVVGNSDSIANNYQLHLDAPLEEAEATAQNDWTIMVYMTASDLAPFAFEDINEMEFAASQLPSTVNFAVLWDQSQTYTQEYDNGYTYTFHPYPTGNLAAWGDTGRGIIQSDTNFESVVTSFERIGEQNTGDSQTLVDFVNWAKDAAPAENYALVMWDHGSGDLFGFNGDDEGNPNNPNKDSMYIDELVSALDSFQNSDNFTFDLISFDACLMAMTEVGYALSDYTDIFVASQENEGGKGYDYTTAFSVLGANPDQVTTEGLATGIVSSYQQQYVPQNTENDTHSASQVNQFDQLVTSLDHFTDTILESATASDWTGLYDARQAATSFGSNPTGFSFEFYRDLGQFVGAIASSNNITTSISEAAQAVSSALQNTIVAQTSDRRDTKGLSVFLPADNILSNAVVQEYLSRNQAFFENTGWLDFVDAFLANEPTDRNNFLTDWAEANNVSARGHNLHTLIGDGHEFADLNLHDPSDQDWFRFTTNEAGITGDKVAVTYDRASGEDLSLLLRYTDHEGQIQERTATETDTGQEISLEGLPNGEYRILVKAEDSIIPEYFLIIDAPGTPTDGKDWARGNNSFNKAEEVGVITAQTQLSGLQVDSSSADWFEFELPKVNSEQIQPIQITVDIPGSSTVKAELFNADDTMTSISSTVGTDELQLTAPNPVPGQVYQLQISQESSEDATAYALFFEPSPQAATDNEPPVFEDIPFSFEVNINQPDQFSATPAASDPEGEDITYSFIGDGNDPDGNGTDAFAIDESSGAITIAHAAELEGQDIFNLTVQASDGELENTAYVTINVTTLTEVNFDIDGDGEVSALTDGILVIRFLAGFTGEALISGAVASEGATRNTAEEIESYLESAQTMLDVDGNGTDSALTDGILAIRSFAGFTGEALINGAVGEGATRSEAKAILNHIQIFLPLEEETMVSESSFSSANLINEPFSSSLMMGGETDLDTGNELILI